jgi:cell division septum initiation protein DivIVA
LRKLKEVKMDIMALIDKLEEAITEGRKVPLSSMVMVDEEKIFEIIDEMRATLPEELKQARWIVKERQDMLDEAEKEAQQIIEEAKEEAKKIASESEVVKLAEKQASEVIEAAKAKEREIRLSAEDYADEIMANLEVNLGKLLSAVQRGRDRLQGKISPRE